MSYRLLNQLARNKYVVAIMIVVSIFVGGIGLLGYVNQDAPAQTELVAIGGQVQNLNGTFQGDDLSQFSFTLSDRETKYIYSSFLPEVENAYAIFSRNPNVTIWIDPTSGSTPDIWGIDIAGSGTYVTYDEFLEARQRNATFGLVVAGMMGLIAVGLMVHFLRLE